jgi:hypothetical protein
MSVTSKLKKGVDLPMWEWLRPLPIATAATGPCTFATGGKPYGRYIYYLPPTTNAGLRYDMYTDGWTTITTPPQSQAVVACTRYNDYHGYSGRIILVESSTTFEAAVPKGNKCVGKTVRIVSGTGAGQTRIITAVSDPNVAETMNVSSGSTIAITDASKSFTINQYRDYGMRIVTNSSTDFRKIIHNTTTEILLADNRFSSVGLPWAYSPLPFTTSSTDGTETRVQIESYTVTIDSPWTVTPNNTSVFVIQSGMLWNINGANARFSLQSYDVLNDNWYQNNSILGGMLNGTLGTDVAIETLNESAVGVLLTRTVSSGAAKTVTLSGATITPNQYSNYIIRIVSGTGIGQDRLIVSHDASNIFTVNRSWAINPDNTSVVEIVADNNKLYMTGNAGAAMFEYDSLNDVWADRRILEVGCPTNLCAVWAGFKRPIGITSITRVTTTATVTTANAHGLKTGDIVTIYGATDSLYNAVNATITVTGQTTFTYTMGGTPAASPAVASFPQSPTVLVDPSKSWTVNEHVGKIVSFTTTAFTQVAGLITNYYHRIITANTATTITFASGTAPTANTTVYMITDMRLHGGLGASQLTGTPSPSATVVTLANPLDGGTMPVNKYSGLRAVVIDGANWGEVGIASNTSTALTFTGAGLAFTPTTTAFVTILGVTTTGAGCTLEYLFNTSEKQKGKYMFATRGGATNYMYLYDITTNTWEVLNQKPNSETFTSGTITAYDGDDRIYIQRDITGRVLYYDFSDNNLYSYNNIPYSMSTATLGNKMSILKTEDGLKFLYIPRHTGTEFWRSLLWI